MQVVKRHNDPILLALLNMLGVASILGFLYCVFALLIGQPSTETTDVVLYLGWFGISILSVYAMRQGDDRGAFALGIATVAMTIYDFVAGKATIGGATLGILVLLIIFGYMKGTIPIDDLNTSQR